MPNQRDYYEVLGLAKAANAEEIKKAYRRLARKFHPDINKQDPAAETKFKEVQEAYDVLSDDKKRTAYDQFGHAGVSSAAAAEAAAAAAATGRGAGSFRYSPQTPGGATMDMGDVDISDLLNSFMGGARRGQAARNPFGGDPFAGQQFQQPQPPVRGEDLTYSASVSFEESIRGTSTDVHIRSTDGRIDETISVKIPPGADDGMKLRVPGHGNLGNGRGGNRGDLVVEVHVRPHAYFTRQGKDIFLDLPVSASEAALGATVSVPTIDGMVDLRIPPGVNSGKKVRVKERGVPQRDGARGDQFCRILIQIPADLTDEEKQQLAALDKAHSLQPRKDVNWK